MNTSKLIGGMALAVVLGSAPAHAGTTEVRSQDGDISRFEYAGDKLRIGVGDQAQGYMVMRDDRVYVVNDSDGNLVVMDISQALGMFGAMASSAMPSMADDEVISLEPTGKKETHAGITGEVYLLRYRESGGEVQESELVLTDDERALEFRDAMLEFAGAMARTMRSQQQVSGNDMQKELMAMNKGVLRYGTEMTVVTLDMSAVDPARFELPAPPTDLSALGALFGGGAAPAEGEAEENSQGGGLSGLLGALSRKRSPEPTAEEAEGGAAGADDAAEEPATEPEPDAAEEISKALRGIFSR
ncbi:MAG: hypothetical protein HKN19_13125 [Halioglobus sp.]|nr:hypothetical protein [Halioglobus sp.]